MKCVYVCLFISLITAKTSISFPDPQENKTRYSWILLMCVHVQYTYTCVCIYTYADMHRHKSEKGISFDSHLNSWAKLSNNADYRKGKELDVFTFFIILPSHLYAFYQNHGNLLNVSWINLYATSTGKTRSRKPLQLVVGTLTPSSVFLSWGFLINPHHDWTLPSHCPNDR